MTSGIGAPMAPSRPRRSDTGVAMLVVMMAMTLLMALAMTLSITGSTETRVWAHYRDGVATLHAADAAMALAIGDLASRPDWSSVLAGAEVSRFVDGPVDGIRIMSGTAIRLAELTQLVRCGKRVGCTDADITAVTDERPWGASNPRWQLFMSGTIGTLLPEPVGIPDIYVVVWVADDPWETDGDPATDGGPPAADPERENPGRDVLRLLAHAWAAGGMHRAIEAAVERTGAGEVRRLSWSEKR